MFVLEHVQQAVMHTPLLQLCWFLKQDNRQALLAPLLLSELVHMIYYSFTIFFVVVFMEMHALTTLTLCTMIGPAVRPAHLRRRIPFAYHSGLARWHDRPAVFGSVATAACSTAVPDTQRSYCHPTAAGGPTDSYCERTGTCTSTARSSCRLAC